jgi:hypothetical protein
MNRALHLLGVELAEGSAGPVPDGVPGSVAGFSEQGLDLGEGYLDWVWIG